MPLVQTGNHCRGFFKTYSELTIVNALRICQGCMNWEMLQMWMLGLEEYLSNDELSTDQVDCHRIGHHKRRK